MLTWTVLAGSVAIVFFVARQAFQSSGISSALAHARTTGEIDDLVTAIEASPEKEQPNHWDQAIGALWREYAREDAARLVIEAAQRSEANVVQYWIRQVLEVEPEIASVVFTQEFMDASFRPEIAAACGKGCGCG